MKVVHHPGEMQTLALEARESGRRIGVVPTMGYLHEGHLSLMRYARPLCDLLVVSIYVNPTQFGAGEDLDAYPRDMERDLTLCRGEEVDIVFCPSDAGMYAPDHSVYVEESQLSRGLCGASRPTHFRGVTTIVTKLFNVVLPHVAVFGQKDYQQAAIIRRMVRDLHFPIEIATVAIAREPDGLAMSSRNRYLTVVERQHALGLSAALSLSHQLLLQGQRDAGALRAALCDSLREIPGVEIDYLEVVDAETLAPAERIERPVVVAIAARVGSTRLIDNTVLDPNGGAA